jgi:UDP-glucose 4-epimerase
LKPSHKHRPTCSLNNNQVLRILVTGGAGFIGSHLVDRLVLKGHRSITVLDNLSRGSTVNLATVWGSIRFVTADIRDRHAFERLVRNTDLIYHLAAQSNVIGAVEDLGYSSSTNIVGSVAILQAARAAGVRPVVFTSSREVYRDPAGLAVPENTPLRPKNVYGMSKVAGETCCRMSAGHALETVILRLANVYEPSDRGRVIPLFAENAMKGRPLTVFGGNQVVDFVELAERILQLTDCGSKVSLRPSHDLGAVRFVAAITRSRTLLGLEYPNDPLEEVAGTDRPNRQRTSADTELSRCLAV